MSLHLDWCSHAAAKYAVEHWHYSRRMPAGKLVKVGVWEDGTFIGCVLFARGANLNIGTPYSLKQIEICELVRVALKKHKSPVSKILSIAIRMLCKQSPGMRLLISYADPEQGHHGGIYQAMGWVYSGMTPHILVMLLPSGEKLHKKTVYSRYGHNDANQLHARWINTGSKHKYLYPLDKAMRAQIAPLAKPYPKRPCAASIDSDAPATQAGEGGATPTAALQHEQV